MSTSIIEKTCFNVFENPQHVMSVPDGVSFNCFDHRLYRRFLKSSISGTKGNEVYECPLLLLHAAELESLSRECVVNLPITSSTEKRAGSSIFRKFMIGSTMGGLMKVTTNKGKVYYGVPGLILDSNFKVIFLATHVYTTTTYPRAWKLSKRKLYINPSVLTSSDTLEKTITKTVLPIYANNKIDAYTRFSRDNYTRVTRGRGVNKITRDVIDPIEIVISDVTDKFIVCPTPPSPFSFNNTIANKVVEDNIKEVFDLMDLSGVEYVFI